MDGLAVALEPEQDVVIWRRAIGSRREVGSCCFDGQVHAAPRVNISIRLLQASNVDDWHDAIIAAAPGPVEVSAVNSPR